MHSQYVKCKLPVKLGSATWRVIQMAEMVSMKTPTNAFEHQQGMSSAFFFYFKKICSHNKSLLQFFLMWHGSIPTHSIVPWWLCDSLKG